MNTDEPIYQSEFTVGAVTIRATVDVIDGEPYSTLTLEQLDHEGRLRPVTAVMNREAWHAVNHLFYGAWMATLGQQAEEQAA